MTSMTINGTPYCAVLENEPLSIDSEYTRFVREFLASTGTLPESQLRTLQLRVRGSFCSLLGMENTVCDFIDLQGVDFSGLELKGLDLSYSYLARAKFCWTRMWEVQLQMSVLTDAILDGAFLYWVQASPTIITGSSWNRATISKSFFEHWDIDMIWEFNGASIQDGP